MNIEELKKGEYLTVEYKKDIPADKENTLKRQLGLPMVQAVD